MIIRVNDLITAIKMNGWDSFALVQSFCLFAKLKPLDRRDGSL